MTEPLHNERGIALVITLLVVAILTITVMEFTFSAHVDQVMGRNALYGLQATLLARSGINRGEAILLADQEPLYDSYLEDWGRIEELDSQLIIPDNMLLKIRVVDEGGKLNINKTRPTNASQCQSFLSETPSMLARMWITALQRLDPQVALAATEYWSKVCGNVSQVPATGQPQATRTPTGQAAAPTPTPAADETPAADWNSYLRDFPTLDDAAAQMGFSTAAVRRLRPYVTALPTLGGGAANKVNANTAPLRVLTAIIGDEAVAHDLITKRQDAALTAGDLSALSSAVANQGSDATTQPANMLGIVSSFYLVRASAIVNPNPTTGRGGIRRSASMLVQRKPRVGQSATVQQGNGQGGPRRWTLTQLDWQKEGGAELFTEKREDETGGEDTPDSQLAAPMGG